MNPEQMVCSDVFLALGSNIEDRLTHLCWAAGRLESHPDIKSIEASSVYETEAHVLPGSEGQGAYLNAVVRIETRFSPARLLDLCLTLERERGRVRTEGERWQARVLDLDVLAYGTLVRRDSHLKIPHPRLGERRFVLEPWAEIAPDFWVPAPFETTVAKLLARCLDSQAIERTACKLLD